MKLLLQNTRQLQTCPDLAVLRLAPWLLALVCCAALHSQGVSVPANDKTEMPNTDVVLKLLETREIPIPKVAGLWIIPPSPTPWDWSPERDDRLDLPQWEHAWEVTHVMFDHSPGRGEDAMNIRWSRKHDLDHTGDGAGSGEYDVEADRNEPALYVISTDVSVKVRIQVKLGQSAGDVRKAKVRAVAGAGAPFMDLIERQVNFDTNGISIGDDGTEYVLFEVAGAVPHKVGDYTVRYKFYFSQSEDANGLPADHPREVMFDELARIDIYSVLATPRKPWNHETSGAAMSLEETQPWVTALGFMCYACGCTNQWQDNTLVGNTVNHLHWGHAGTSGHGMKYDHIEGRPGYTTVGREQFTHNFTGYMTKRVNDKTPNVSCADQASAVHAVLQLARSHMTGAWYLRGNAAAGRAWFGYMHPSLFVGGVQSNHPFHLNRAYVNQPIVGNDDLITQTTSGLIKRSAFNFHAAVWVRDSEAMADACFGPVVPSSGLSLAAYLALYRDTTTADEQTIGGNGLFAPGDEVEVDLSIR